MHVASFLPYLSSRIHYYAWGSGPKIVFAFHGYGESGDSFAFIGTAIDPGFTLIAIDLPFHGLTEWNEGPHLGPPQLIEIMEMIASPAVASVKAGFAPRQTDPGRRSSSEGGVSPKAGLLGYSMGGRIAMRLLQDAPERFDNLTLVAPDGMVVSPWYWIATATTAGNRLFRWSMRRPGPLFLLLRCCQFFRALNPSVYKFALHYIDDDKARHDLYVRWTATRRFKPDLSRIAALIVDRRIPVNLIYGKFDRIIRWQRAAKFQERTAATSRLIVVEAGHQLLRPQFLPVFLSLYSAGPVA